MTEHVRSSLPSETDVLLIGAGIMSATLGTLLQFVAPHLQITLVDTLGEASSESSDAWNNAGTGHAALCELNYTPERPDGTIAIDRAIDINEQFQQSRQFWATLVERGVLGDPSEFIHAFPHLSFVSGTESVDFLRRRFAAMQTSPLFAKMRFTEDRETLEAWVPLMMEGRDEATPAAATRADDGTDLDFGRLTRLLLLAMEKQGSTVHFRHKVVDLRQQSDHRWQIEVEDLATGRRSRILTRFLFLGAGGGALLLLQKSGVPEGRGYGGFPVSGQWLRCTNRELIERHAAKVYGKPALGAPPMSVPHLDTRMIDGRKELLFGPFAGFSTKFLKSGSYTDLIRSIGAGNLRAMLGAGIHNVELTRYLIGQVMQSQNDRVGALRDFVPLAQAEDWRLEVAGQRVQIIKPDPARGGVLEFGTKVIRTADGSLAALLGASPGASTAVAIMLQLISAGMPVLREQECMEGTLQGIVQSYGRSLHADPALFERVSDRTGAVLRLG
ncbi:malate dehydrogenase (quinone) [Acidipila sp. EB88]|uniref:malate dehydrogenase (quinone) n=1 Tax=Acidipila sp. EB88 TaxID=2305226 RepID=UPI000F5F8302|nr:malate dehydrogenase (quinone) [Acidipila sp. EB88]RRA50221.1 malate dehydrogenase (quinone) [Acidipila sp. EB88]